MEIQKVLHGWIEWSFSSAFWRYATAAPVINIKSSTPKAKKICVMAILHRTLLYIALKKLIVPRNNIFNFAHEDFETELAEVQTPDQMSKLVQKLKLALQMKSETDEGEFPTLNSMEFEMVHLVNRYKTERMAYQAKSVPHIYNFLINVKEDPEAYAFMYEFVGAVIYSTQNAPILSLQFYPLLAEMGSLSGTLNNQERSYNCNNMIISIIEAIIFKKPITVEMESETGWNTAEISMQCHTEHGLQRYHGSMAQRNQKAERSADGC